MFDLLIVLVLLLLFSPVLAVIALIKLGGVRQALQNLDRRIRDLERRSAAPASVPPPADVATPAPLSPAPSTPAPPEPVRTEAVTAAATQPPPSVSSAPPTSVPPIVATSTSAPAA